MTETNQTSGPPGSRRQTRGKGRLEALSDGVFAVAITLLALDLAVPANGHSERHLLDAIGDQWPGYLGYVVSFATIGALWLGHNAITDYLDRCRCHLSAPEPVGATVCVLPALSNSPRVGVHFQRRRRAGGRYRVRAHAPGRDGGPLTFMEVRSPRPPGTARCQRRGSQVTDEAAQPEPGGVRRADSPGALFTGSRRGRLLHHCAVPVDPCPQPLETARAHLSLNVAQKIDDRRCRWVSPWWQAQR